VVESQRKTDVKKTEDKYLKALYASEQQKEDVDRMLEIGKYAEVASMGESKYTEYDNEIDSLIEDAERGASRGGRQRY